MTYEVNKPKTGYRVFCVICNKRVYSKRGLQVTKRLEENTTVFRTGISNKDLKPSQGMGSSFESFIFPNIVQTYPKLIDTRFVNSFFEENVFVCSETCANMYILQNI